eukprot:707826-Alexandrium_andersonii.AAC.1
MRPGIQPHAADHAGSPPPPPSPGDPSPKKAPGARPPPAGLTGSTGARRGTRGGWAANSTVRA